MATRVLIAHGDTHELERVVAELTRAGCEVVATPDGGDAFARFFEEDPDLVVCSESLPVLDGRSFGNMIHSQAPSVPVVLLVARDAPTQDDDFLILQEPVDVEALFALVPDLVPKDRSESIELDVPAENQPPVTDPANETHAELRRFQRQGNLLALLDDSGMERLAAIAERQELAGDARVICEGDPCDGFYLVLGGEVRVTLAERGDQEVARLGTGEFFGEMALLSDQPRSASVWTCGETELLFFEREAVLQLLEDYPNLREVLGGMAVQRAEENLFQALSGDDDVQRNLSELLEGLEVDMPAEEAPSQRGEDLPEFVGEPTQPDIAAPHFEPATPAASTLAARLRAYGIRLGQSLRLWVLGHQFESGLIVGVVAGIGLSLLAMAVLTAGDGGQELAVVPQEPVAAVVEEQPGAPEPSLPVAAAPDEPSEPEASEEPAPIDAAPDVAAAEAGEQPAEPEADEKAVEPIAAVPEPPESDPEPEDEAPAAAEKPPPQQQQPPPGMGRKAMRKKLMQSFAGGDFEAAARWGGHMRARFELDWEAWFTLAQAQRRAGQKAEALTDYLAFAEAHPTNAFADDAQFWAAEILVSTGRRDEAIDLFEAIVRNPAASMKARAERRLAALRR